MLGSAGWYALLDDRYPLQFHVTLIALSLLAMGLGSLLRVRLYVALGFLGLLTDLASLVGKSLLHMERSVRMSLIGSQVLLVGAALVFGAIYYKTHQEQVNLWVEAWRRRMLEWE
jgi:predicted membrane channel-forming protein YqfA (hemolysin III family)